MGWLIGLRSVENVLLNGYMIKEYNFTNKSISKVNSNVCNGVVTEISYRIQFSNLTEG